MNQPDDPTKIIAIDLFDGRIGTDEVPLFDLGERVFAHGPVGRRPGFGCVVSVDRGFAGAKWVKIAPEPRGVPFVPPSWTPGDVLVGGGEESP